MARKRIHTPSWFSLALHRFLWSKRVAPLLSELGYGWLDGGCRTCMEALWTFVTLSQTIDPSEVQPQLVTDINMIAHHVVLSIRHGGSLWFLDANGVSTSEQLLWYWHCHEQLRSPFLCQVDSTLLDEDGIVCHPWIKTRLTEELLDYFGPFRPIWLEV